MKVLLLGANGQVGHALLGSLPSLGDVVPATRGGMLDGRPCETADLDQPDAVAEAIARVAPDVVVNAAAYTAVDRAEAEPEAAYQANAVAPGEIARACARHGALLVHYSTDYVFDGSGTRPYREQDPTAPLGVYGASKREGELAIQDSGCRHLILRTAWVYGLHGHNFLKTMLRMGAERDQLSVVGDQVGTPTSAALIARCTTQALQCIAEGFDASGTWHLTAAGETSWHGFATEIMRQASESGMLAHAPEVTAITTADYPTRARRPAYSCMDTKRLRSDFRIDLPDWRVDLADVLAPLAA